MRQSPASRHEIHPTHHTTSNSRVLAEMLSRSLFMDASRLKEVQRASLKNTQGVEVVLQRGRR